MEVGVLLYDRAAASRDKPWSMADDAAMLDCLRQNQSFEEVAQLLERRPQEIRERIAFLAREAEWFFPKDAGASYLASPRWQPAAWDHGSPVAAA